MAISYHPKSCDFAAGKHFSYDFRVADTDDLSRISKGIAQYAWSGIIWKSGRRLKTEFLYSDYCVLDIDDEEQIYPITQAINEFCDKKHIIGTTRNHQKEKNGITCDRYRIVVPWDKRIESAEIYEGNMHALRQKMDALDASTLSAAQHFFPCATIASLNLEGYGQDVLNRKHKVEQISETEYRELMACQTLNFKILGRLPDWVEDFLAGGAPAGARHRMALGAALEMLEHGLPIPSVVARLSAAKISRPYAHGEVQNIVKYALQRIKGRIRDGQT